MNRKFNRREFTWSSLVLASSMLLPKACKPSRLSPTQKKDKIGVALLGLGSYSRGQLAPALQLTEHCYLAGIITGSPDKIPNWQSQYDIPDTHVYTYDEMHRIADNNDVDVIYIVTPTGTHRDFAVAAAETGKHVWCEKPMAMNVAECQEIMDACNKNKVQLTIGYRMLHEPNTQTLISYSHSKPFGDIVTIDSQAGYAGGGGSGWRHQRAMGGGALYDMGVYTVNGMRYAADMMPTKVIAARQYADRPELFTEVDETTEYTLEFSNGIIGKGKTSVGKNINLLKVSCAQGHYELSPMQSYHGVVGRRSDGVLLDTYLPNQQAKQMDDDALALLEGKKMMIDPIEGLKDIRIIQAIIKSADMGRSVDV